MNKSIILLVSKNHRHAKVFRNYKGASRFLKTHDNYLVVWVSDLLAPTNSSDFHWLTNSVKTLDEDFFFLLASQGGNRLEI